jgi:TusA-related sulfurtransferase
VSPSPDLDGLDGPDGSPDPAGDADVVDARGQRCPLPVIRLARLVHDDPRPRVVTVLATDPAAAHDVPAWCRMRGHRFVGARDRGDHTAYDVEVLPGQATPAP